VKDQDPESTDHERTDPESTLQELTVVAIVHDHENISFEPSCFGFLSYS
jgi:hypothetical protein